MANVLYDLGHQNIGILLVVCNEDRIEGDLVIGLRARG